MDNTIASRMKMFIDSAGLTSTQFADMCGIARPSLSQILSGRNKKISDKIISLIHKTFPDLSVLWLLFGEGPVKNSSIGGNESISGTGRSRNLEGGVINFGTEKEGDSLGIMAENPGELTKGTLSYNNSRENGLNDHNIGSNYSKNSSLEVNIQLLDLQRQIENLKNNPRKVLQITIYYDDSTFETFVPKGS